MTVKMLESGETAQVSASYGLRLIEQGRAVAVSKNIRRSAAKADKGEA